jgi:hypothetical protein
MSASEGNSFPEHFDVSGEVEENIETRENKTNYFAREQILLSISGNFSTRCSQVRCELANYVVKFGRWA